MPHDLRALTRDDLPTLSRFLTDGFGTHADAPFASPAILGWKYLDPMGPEAGEAPRSLLAVDRETGEILGHLGVCPSRWHGPGLPDAGVSTLHMMDWLGSRSAVGVGAALMRRAHESTETQFGLGGSVAGRGVGGRGGYALRRLVPVFGRVLRPLYRLRDRTTAPSARLPRAAKDALGALRRRARRPSARVTLRPLSAFGDEAVSAVRAYRSEATFTTREPERLNHLLGYPLGGLSGWAIEAGGRDVGFALLSVVSRPGGVREGRVVDCLGAGADEAVWQAAMVAAADTLRSLGADVAQAVGSTPWAERALRSAGFVETHRLEFRLRDRGDRLPADGPVHLTLFEADYAYV